MTASPTLPAAPTTAYLRTRVLTASPEELRLLLLDGAIRFAIQGREGLALRDYEAAFNGLTQCRAILVELLTTIRPDADEALAARVRALYTFLFSEVVEASFQKSTERLDHVIRILQYERETWVMLMSRLASERAAGADARGQGEPVSLQA